MSRRSAERVMTQTEEDQTRIVHNSENSLHGRAGCKVCQLLLMLVHERERRKAAEEALTNALRVAS